MNSLSTIEKIHDAYDEKKLSPLELTKKYLQEINKDSDGSYLHICEKRALDQADQFEKVMQKEGKVPRQSQPLFGIPFGIKDVLVLDGVKTTCASKMLENYIPPYTASSLLKMEQAGAITLGKLNMDEFAMGSSNENSAFGPVKHPTHPEYVPGGSSGGSAAAVKAGLCVASLGTDTGGSIRLPASFCGVVGIKPTYGRVSRYGLVAFASSLDQIGTLSQSVEDGAKILQVISGKDEKDSTMALEPPIDFSNCFNSSMDWSKLKVGVPKEYFNEGLSEDVKKSVENALSWFESKGAQLVEVSLPHTQYAVSCYYLVAVSEASSNLARFDGVRYGLRSSQAESNNSLIDFYKSVRSHFGEEVKRRIILGTFALSSGYYDAYYKKACQVRRLIQNDFLKAFEKVDVIASAVAPTTAFKRGEKTSDPLQMYLQDILTIPASLAGLPAMSIPCGKGDEGLPVGMQLIGKAFDEKTLLSVAHGFEQDQAGLAVAEKGVCL